MKCVEIFYDVIKAVKFANSKAQEYKEADVEMVKTIDEDVDESVYVVYFNPPKKEVSA